MREPGFKISYTRSLLCLSNGQCIAIFHSAHISLNRVHMYDNSDFSAYIIIIIIICCAKEKTMKCLRPGGPGGYKRKKDITVKRRRRRQRISWHAWPLPEATSYPTPCKPSYEYEYVCIRARTTGPIKTELGPNVVTFLTAARGRKKVLTRCVWHFSRYYYTYL